MPNWHSIIIIYKLNTEFKFICKELFKFIYKYLLYFNHYYSFLSVIGEYVFNYLRKTWLNNEIFQKNEMLARFANLAHRKWTLVFESEF